MAQKCAACTNASTNQIVDVKFCGECYHHLIGTSRKYDSYTRAWHEVFRAFRIQLARVETWTEMVQNKHVAVGQPVPEDVAVEMLMAIAKFRNEIARITPGSLGADMADGKAYAKMGAALRNIGGDIDTSTWLVLMAGVREALEGAMDEMAETDSISQASINKVVSSMDALLRGAAEKMRTRDPVRRYDASDFRSRLPSDANRIIETFSSPTWPQVLAQHPETIDTLQRVAEKKDGLYATIMPEVRNSITALEIQPGEARNVYIPADIGLLTSLRHLSLTSLQWADIPASFTSLTNLKSLKIFFSRFNNNHKDLVKTFPLLEDLQLISVGFENGLAPMPDSVLNPRLSRLTYADQPNPVVFPENANQFRLRQLHLSSTTFFFSGLGQDFGQFTTLESLVLSGVNLWELPDNIGNLVALTRLFVDKNQLQDLPPSFSTLTSLAVLNVSDNPIQDLSIIGALTNLVELTVGPPRAARRDFYTIPAALARLVRLEELKINYVDQVKSIDPALATLPRLKKVVAYPSTAESTMLLTDVFTDEQLGGQA